MTTEVHIPLNTGLSRWLPWLADPTPAHSPPPIATSADELARLLEAAELHGVLAACLANLKRPEAEHCGSVGDAHRQEIIEAWSRRLVELVSVQMLLAHHARNVQRHLTSKRQPFAVIKGQTFAERLYPTPIFRRYTDIDLLIPVHARAEIGEALEKQGFVLQDIGYRKGADYFEDKWLLRADPRIMIEVHCDLVHNPKLRRDFHLGFEDILAAGDSDAADATALLLVAGVHGAVGHQFDKLQHLVDVLQCARGAAGPIDIKRLRAVSARCGLTFAVVAALDLAARTFADQSCRSLLAELMPRAFERAASRLLSPTLVVDAQSQRRYVASWRRKIFRQALRGSARRPAPASLS